MMCLDASVYSAKQVESCMCLTVGSFQERNISQCCVSV